MAHLKKDFNYHNIFKNKYIDQTYYSYLYRDNTRYIPRSDDWIPIHAIDVWNFIILCNNDICRRGSIEIAKENIKKKFDKIFKKKYQLNLRQNYYYREDRKDGFLKDVVEFIENSENSNEVQKEESSLIKELIYWKENIENDFEGFKDFIFDKIKYFDEKHYDWNIGENVIYNRSIRDNENKRVYCAINNDKADVKFKKLYFANVSVESKYKTKLYKQISYLLITLADVNNLFVSKEFKKAKELLNDYLEDNLKMNTCIDIYYRKIFESVCGIAKRYNLDNNSHNTFNEIQKIIRKENNKYIDDITLFESVAIDLENDVYSNIENI